MFLRGGIFDRFVKSGRVGGGGLGIPKQSFYQLSLTSSVFYKGDRKGESKGGMVFKKGGVKAEKGSQKGSYTYYRLLGLATECCLSVSVVSVLGFWHPAKNRLLEGRFSVFRRFVYALNKTGKTDFTG